MCVNDILVAWPPENSILLCVPSRLNTIFNQSINRMSSTKYLTCEERYSDICPNTTKSMSLSRFNVIAKIILTPTA